MCMCVRVIDRRLYGHPAARLVTQGTWRARHRRQSVYAYRSARFRLTHIDRQHEVIVLRRLEGDGEDAGSGAVNNTPLSKPLSSPLFSTPVSSLPPLAPFASSAAAAMLSDANQPSEGVACQLCGKVCINLIGLDRHWGFMHKGLPKPAMLLARRKKADGGMVGMAMSTGDAAAEHGHVDAEEEKSEAADVVMVDEQSVGSASKPSHKRALSRDDLSEGSATRSKRARNAL